MAEKTGMTMDFSSFNAGFRDLINTVIPGHAQKGLFQAGALIIRHAITEEPRVPHLTGHLWRSQKIEVLKEDGNFIGVAIGFNTDYAAKLHEAPSGWNWTMPGSGPKYLSSSMVGHRNDAMQKCADYIQSQGRRV
jgi:hypothetical protein